MDTPALTMVTLTDGSYDVCAAAVRHFARQSVLEKVELIVVCATRDALGEVDEETFRGFHSVKLLPIGTFDTTAEGVAAAVRAASAPLVGLIEEHDFLPPNLAEVVIREMADETVQAVGFGMEPANPGVVAWAHLYLQFGIAVAPVRSGGAPCLGGHHAVYRRKLLLGYGDDLVDVLGNEAVLHEDLRRRGHRMFMTGDAVTEHLQISRIADLVRHEFISQRSYAAARASVMKWSPARRLGYALGSPAIPALRLARAVPAVLRTPEGRRLLPRIIGPMTVGAVSGAAGEAVGYLAGGSETGERARLDIELHRRSYLNVTDRATGSGRSSRKAV